LMPRYGCGAHQTNIVDHALEPSIYGKLTANGMETRATSGCMYANKK
jgi:hypothetical protein